jgi:hypothetical protein
MRAAAGKALGDINFDYMKNKNLLIKILVGVIVILTCLIAVDIFIHLKYCSEVTFFKFDSTEFNHIATPIISLFGVFGLIITILLSMEQIKFGKSQQYFSYITEKINTIISKSHTQEHFSGMELLKYLDYVDDKYDALSQDPQYVKDIKLYHNGEKVNSDTKSYDSLLANVRSFHIQAFILYQRLLNMVKEVEHHKYLDNIHKQLIFESLIGDVISNYLASCNLLLKDHSEMVEKFYTSINSDYPEQDLLFFNKKFFSLKTYIDERKFLLVYYEKN